MHIKSGTITHSAKETRQQKEQWGWRLDVTGKWEGGGQNLKRGGGVGNVRGGLHKIGGVRNPRPTMNTLTLPAPIPYKEKK